MRSHQCLTLALLTIQTSCTSINTEEIYQLIRTNQNWKRQGWEKNGYRTQMEARMIAKRVERGNRTLRLQRLMEIEEAVAKGEDVPTIPLAKKALEEKLEKNIAAYEEIVEEVQSLRGERAEAEKIYEQLLQAVGEAPQGPKEVKSKEKPDSKRPSKVADKSEPKVKKEPSSPDHGCPTLKKPRLQSPVKMEELSPLNTFMHGSSDEDYDLPDDVAFPSSSAMHFDDFFQDALLYDDYRDTSYLLF